MSKVEKSFSAGKNSSYSVRDNNGNKSAYGFDSKSDAQAHINERESIGQSPTSINTDYTAMAEYLLNH